MADKLVITLQDKETKSIWRCTEGRHEFNEFVKDEFGLDNTEDYEAFMELHKSETPIILKCENIPCFAGDDIFVIYFYESGACASTFDGFITEHEKPFKTLDAALEKVLIIGYDED